MRPARGAGTLRAVRVLSYNIHKGIGGRDRRYRLRRVQAVIAAARADVLCLQEVDRNVRRSRFDDQPKLLAEWFLGRRLPPVGPHPGSGAARGGGAVFQLTLPLKTGRGLPGGPRSGGYGNLIVSKRPILDAHLVGLRRGVRKNRGAVVVVLDTPAGPVRLVNWHLGLAERERHWQVRKLLSHELFKTAGGVGPLPTLLLGDTNDWRGTLPRGALGEAGYTLLPDPPRRFRTFPAWLPAAGLDKAFAKDFDAAASVHRGGPAADASDHLPLAIDVRG